MLRFVAHPALPIAYSTNLIPKLFLLPYQVCVPNFNSFRPIELILTQDTTFEAYPVTWFTNLISFAISIALTSMCTEFQFIWSNRTHSDPRCYVL
jgi:hypothetical protein